MHVGSWATANTLRGYPGDDDSGAMSSYYVWVSMGIFPNAGQDIYFLSGPLYDRIVVHRPDDGLLIITAHRQGRIYCRGDDQWQAARSGLGASSRNQWRDRTRFHDERRAYRLGKKDSPTPSDEGRAKPLP